MDECKDCEFCIKEVRDIRTSVIAWIGVFKRGIRVCCKHRREIEYSCGITDYNEYPDNCPYKSESDTGIVISGEEHKPSIGDYYKLINANL